MGLSTAYQRFISSLSAKEEAVSEEPVVHRTHYNPVTVEEGVGTFFLGVLCLALLIALLRSEARYRRLVRARRTGA